MTQLPNFTVEGGCICGALRYQLTAPPLAVYACHCKDCQRAGSAPYAVGLFADKASFDVIANGGIHRFDKPADSGRVVPQFSCAVCGTRVWHEPVTAPNRVIIRAGTLDDADWAVPAAHIWTASRSPLANIPADAPQFPGQVPDRQVLIDAWEAALP